MAVYSNLPTFTYVKWDNMMIAYNGQVYSIQNGYTNNKYVYFDSSNPYQLSCSNEKKTEIGGRFLVIINEKGIHTLVPHEDLVITFDGDNSDLIAEKIFGIYETNAEFGEKFTSIETDIEGVKTTVGKVEKENNQIKESVSSIDQKADKISQEVKNIEKTFNESQDSADLRERLNKSIIDINTSLGIFKSYFGEIKTGTLDNVTKTEINTHIDVLIKNKDAMILQVNKVEILMEQGGFTDKLNALTSSKTVAINAIDNLVTIIRTSISDNTYVPSEVTIIVDAFGKAVTKINMLKNSCDDCIFLGAGGSVSEELSRLEMKSDKIVLSVSKTEETLKNTLSVNKAQVQSQIQDLQTVITKFKQSLKSIFTDGLVSEIEESVINEHYTKLDKEKSDIESLYNTYVSDVNLSESQKNSLISTYNNFVAAHNNVKNKVNEVIQDGFANESEIVQIESELLKYEDQSNQLLRTICYSLDNIEVNRNNKVVEEAKKQMQQEIGEVNTKVDSLDNTINTTFKDNVIDEAERTSIKQNLNILNSEKTDIDNQYEQLYKNTHLAGQLKIDFKIAYDAFVGEYDSLIAIINGILDKPTLIEDNDRRNMDNAYELMNASLAGFTTVVNQVIENVAKKEAEFVKSQLDKDIEEVNNKIDGLDLSIDGTFVNNILDQAERKDIEDNLNTLKREKIDVDNQYNQLILSSYLDGRLKVDYTNKYNEFTTRFTALEKVITDILEKVDLINDTDRLNMNSAHESLNTVLGELVTLSNKVIEYIGKKQSESTREDLTGQLGDLNNKVDNIVGNVTEAVSDSVLDKSERQTLKESLNILNAQKSQVDSQYTLVYNNANLANSPIKNELKTAYDSFNQKYSLLISSIENLLGKVENITEVDRNNYANSYNEYKTAISNYTAKLQLANEEIFNKGIKDAKQELNNEILDVSKSLSNLSNTMEGVFKDGILSESEKIAIRQNLKTLETEKLDIDKTYDILYSNDKLIGSAKVNLKSSYDNYIEKYNNLISVINGILDKVGLVDSIDQKKLNTAFDAHKVALGNFREKYNLALDSVTTKSVEDVKQSLVQDIGEVSGAVDSLQNTMNGVFKDGILSDSEKLAIKQNLQSLLVEKADIDKQYSVIYNNADLLGDAKTNLKTAYDDYISKYNSLVNTINTIINKSGIVDSADNDSLNAAFTSHSVALGTYSMRINEAIDSIAKKKSDDAYNNSKTYTNSEITVLSDSINSKVSKIEEKQSEMDGNLNTLNIWKTEAEQKITDEAITNTVKKNFYTKEETENSITSKGYQTQSEVQQTVDSFEVKIGSSGGYNELLNSNFNAEILSWVKYNSPSVNFNPNVSATFGKVIAITGSVTGQDSGIYQIFSTIPGKVYTCSFYAEPHGVTNVPTAIGIDGVNVINIAYNSFRRYSFTFTATSTTHAFVAYSKLSNGTFYLGRPMVSAGEMLYEYSPNPNEVLSTTAQFTIDGMTISSASAGVKTNVNTDGMNIIRTSDGKSLLKATSKGVRAEGGMFYVEDIKNGYTYFWGRDIVINDQRALVGTNANPESTLDPNKLYINYNNDFKNGVDIGGKITNDGRPVLSESHFEGTDTGILVLSNGFIIQWGKIGNLSITGGEMLSRNLTFPIKFNNKCFFAGVDINSVDDGNGDLETRYNAWLKHIDKNGAVLKVRNYTDQKWGSKMEIYWFAIGS